VGRHLFALLTALTFAAPLAWAEASKRGVEAWLPAPPRTPPAVPRAILETLPPGARPALGLPDVSAGPVDLDYTVDPRLEERVREVLTQGRVSLGHVIVIHPADGRVLAYVSTAPELFPATRVYPTASLMKVVTAGAVLQHAPEAAKRGCRYNGSPHRLTASRLRPPREGGRVDSFWRALAISNNQCFARYAVHDVGAESMLEEMRRLGMLDAPAPGHPKGVVEPIESDLDLGELGSGLAGSFITPLAAARLAAVLAHGALVHPRWIARATDARGHELPLPPLPEPRRVWPEAVTAELRELLVGPTARGSAKSAFRDARGRPLLGDVRVAGKTGRLSGTNPDGRYEWFIGVAPAEAPRIAIATLVVNGDLWWTSSSQLAARVLREIFCEKRVCSGARAARWQADRAGSSVERTRRPAR
jgi:cell division protein FtsI/penicillin-binding protein 2